MNSSQDLTPYRELAALAGVLLLYTAVFLACPVAGVALWVGHCWYNYNREWR